MWKDSQDNNHSIALIVLCRLSRLLLSLCTPAQWWCNQPPLRPFPTRIYISSLAARYESSSIRNTVLYSLPKAEVDNANSIGDAAWHFPCSSRLKRSCSYTLYGKSLSGIHSTLVSLILRGQKTQGASTSFVLLRVIYFPSVLHR